MLLLAFGINYGSNNVFIGHRAALNESGSNKLYIENTDSPIPLIGGGFATDRVGINADVSTLAHNLTVGGSVKIQTLLNLTPSITPATPIEGDVYYDSTVKKIRVYTGATWENLN